MTQWFVVVTEIGSAFFLRLFKAQRAGSDGNPIAILQQMFEHLFAVDKDLVRAAFDLTVDRNAINNHERSVVISPDMRVVTGRARVVKHDLIVGRAPNHAWGARVHLICRLASAGVGDFQLGHTWIFES